MATEQFQLRSLKTNIALKAKVYTALKEAIASMDIYGRDDPLKLDEYYLAEKLGVSRTPVREALSRLEQEGLVQMIPRRGAFVIRKSKKEILEIIAVWAALESMAARLATQVATDEQISKLREMFVKFEEPGRPQARIDEYSDTNIQFHQAIIALSGNDLLVQLADAPLLHMRAIRARTIGERDRASRSIIDHMHIIEAIEDRDTELAERLVRDHSFGLADHVEKYVDYLD
jgi:DNA-binding GntR family transcriptional regulator